MFILNFIKTVPILFIINVYANTTDSSLIYYNLGSDYERTSTFERSEFYFKKAIESSKDSSLITKSLIYLGVLSKRQGKYKSALDSYLSAETYTNDPQTLLMIYANQGVVNKITGDYEKALLLYHKALKLTYSEKQKAYILNNIANIYYEQNNFQKALKFYQESVIIKKRIQSKEIYSTFLNIAICYQELGEIKKAESFFNKTLQGRVKLFGNKHSRLIIAYINYGSFLINTRPVKSFALLSKANELALLNYREKHPETAKTYVYLGDYYNSRKEYYKVLEQYQKALIANSSQFNNLDFYKNPPVTDAISELAQLEILHKKAIAFQEYAYISCNKQKDLETSLVIYELAIETLFKLQNSFMDESKRSLIADKKDLFTEAAQVAIQLNDNLKAFQLFEKGKAFTLLATINNNEAIKYSDIPDSLVHLENEFKRLQFVYSANNNADSVLLYQERYDNLINYFEKHYPKYHNLKHKNTIIDPRIQLDTNQVLIEYALTAKNCNILTVKKQGFNYYSFDIDSSFHNQLNIFINLLKNYDRHKKYTEQYNQYISSAHYLWRKLIYPLNISPNKSLIIIPDGKLSYIPFEALITEKPPKENKNYYSLKYLLHKNPISYSYSAQWLLSSNKNNNLTKTGAFAIDYREWENYNTLSNAPKEAKTLTRFFKGKAFINKDCTKKAFIKNAKNYNILHLSMHGDINHKDPLNSKLIFTDENLYAWEVYGMKLNSRLAYLSACSTGDGKLDKGEGLFSMGRAFAYAGCSTIIMSLWVDKDKVSHITLSFYKYLRKGYTLDIAMQKAKIDHLNQFFDSHPHYWSNKIVMGNTKKIDTQPSVWLYILAALIFLPVLYYLRKKIY